MSLGSIIDSIIGTFSPRTAARRIINRTQLERLKGQRSALYAAAKSTRLTGSWSPAGGGVNDIIAASSGAVRERVRQLVRDFPYFSAALDRMVDYSVGSGIYPQSRVRDSQGNYNKKLQQQIEDAFKFWADKADYTGKLHYFEMMQLAKRQDLEAGEFLLIKRVEKRPGQYLPFYLDMVEPDNLSGMARPAGGGNKIHEGVEYNPKTGLVAAYHVAIDGFKSTAIKSEAIIHGFKTLRPGQLRGISPYTPGVLLAKDLDDLLGAELDTAKMASKYLAMVTTPDIEGRVLGNSTTDDNGDRVEELENAIIEYLRPGESIEIANNPRPGSTFAPFVKLILTMFAITAGIPYELISGDYSGVNWSSGKLIRTDFAHALKPITGRHIRQFCNHTFEPFMDWAVMTGKIDAPGYWSNKAVYLDIAWQRPGMEPVDPLREVKAQVDEIANYLRSPQEIVAARGRDLADVIKEIAEAKEMAEEAGLDWGDVSTALANNPAALGGGEKKAPDLEEIRSALEEILEDSIN